MCQLWCSRVIESSRFGRTIVCVLQVKNVSRKSEDMGRCRGRCRDSRVDPSCHSQLVVVDILLRNIVEQ